MTVGTTHSCASVTAIFDLADDGCATDVARQKDELIAKAICDDQSLERKARELRVDSVRGSD